jgi:fumarate reductase flavoprotein subunit
MISDEAAIAATNGATFRGEKLAYESGDTPEALAAALGVDAAGLAKTIEDYNAACATGFDREFGRRDLAPLAAPFRALPVLPCEIITYGGVSRNTNSEVIRADESVVSGLYCAGEISSSSAYMGFTLSNAFTWGRIAARNAATYIKSLG